MTLTHPGLSAPAKVVYFVGWVEPRKDERYAAFLRFVNDVPAYETLGLGDPEKRSAIADSLQRWLRRQDRQTIDSAVSIPGGCSAFEPICYGDLPVVLWPHRDTLRQMKTRLNDGPRPA